MVLPTHVQVKRKQRGVSRLPNGEYNGISKFDLGFRLLQWRALQFHISSQQLMSTSCQIDTKNVPRGYPGQSCDVLRELAIWGFGDYDVTKWAVLCQHSKQACCSPLLFSLTVIRVLHLFSRAPGFNSEYPIIAFMPLNTSEFILIVGPQKTKADLCIYFLIVFLLTTLFPLPSLLSMFSGCWLSFQLFMERKEVRRILNILFSLTSLWLAKRKKNSTVEIRRHGSSLVQVLIK